MARYARGMRQPAMRLASSLAAATASARMSLPRQLRVRPGPGHLSHHARLAGPAPASQSPVREPADKGSSSNSCPADVEDTLCNRQGRGHFVRRHGSFPCADTDSSVKSRVCLSLVVRLNSAVKKQKRPILDGLKPYPVGKLFPSIMTLCLPPAKRAAGTRTNQLYSSAFKSSPTSAARHGNQPDP